MRNFYRHRKKNIDMKLTLTRKWGSVLSKKGGTAWTCLSLLFCCSAAYFGLLSRGQPHLPDFNQCYLVSTRNSQGASWRGWVPKTDRALTGVSTWKIPILSQLLNPLGHSIHFSLKTLKRVRKLYLKGNRQQYAKLPNSFVRERSCIIHVFQDLENCSRVNLAKSGKIIPHSFCISS